MKQENTNSFRKILAGLCMLCMVCMTCFGTMSVYAGGNAKLTASECTAERGKTVSVTLNLEGNPGLWGLKFKVGYDHSALKLTSVTNGIVFPGEEVIPPESLDKEQYVFLGTGGNLEDIQTNGEMVTLKFEVAKEAAFADYPIDVEIIQAINADGKEISIAAEDGRISVQPEAQLQAEDNGVMQAKGPKTGDNSHLFLWVVFAGGSVCAMLALGISIKKKRWIKA